MFIKITSKNLTGFQNLSGLVCEIIYLNFIFHAKVSLAKSVKYRFCAQKLLYEGGFENRAMQQRSLVAQVAQKKAQKHYELVSRQNFCLETYFLNKTIKMNIHCSCPF